MPCTDPTTGQLIGSYELGLLSDEERKRFEAHTLQCEHCFQDLYRTAPLIAKMKPASPARRRRAWPVLLGAAAALVLIIFAARTFGPSQPPEQLRGTEQGSVVVYAPIGEVPQPTELDWKIVPPATSYEVTITTPEGEIVWKGTTQAPPLELPQAVSEQLEPKETYFWQVEALGEEGQSWSSPQTKFTVRD